MIILILIIIIINKKNKIKISYFIKIKISKINKIINLIYNSINIKQNKNN
jgi:hypothetical protein